MCSKAKCDHKFIKGVVHLPWPANKLNKDSKKNLQSLPVSDLEVPQ